MSFYENQWANLTLSKEGEVSRDQGAGNGKFLTKLLVNYLPQTLTEEELHTIFSSCGQLLSVRIVRDVETNSSFGYGFVEYFRPEDAAHAVQTLKGYPVRNKQLGVTYSRVHTKEEIMDNNLCVANLPISYLNDDSVRQLFGVYGKIISIKISRDLRNGHLQGTAFVRFNRREEALRAIHELNGTHLTGSLEPLAVKVSKEHGKLQAEVLKKFQIKLPEPVPHLHLPSNSSGYSEPRPSSQHSKGGGLIPTSPYCANPPPHPYLTSNSSGYSKPRPSSQHSKGGGLIPSSPYCANPPPHPYLTSNSSGYSEPRPSSQHSKEGGLIPSSPYWANPPPHLYLTSNSSGYSEPRPSSQHSKGGGLIPSSPYWANPPPHPYLTSNSSGYSKPRPSSQYSKGGGLIASGPYCANLPPHPYSQSNSSGNSELRHFEEGGLTSSAPVCVNPAYSNRFASYPRPRTRSPTIVNPAFLSRNMSAVGYDHPEERSRGGGPVKGGRDRGGSRLHGSRRGGSRRGGSRPSDRQKNISGQNGRKGNGRKRFH